MFKITIPIVNYSFPFQKITMHYVDKGKTTLKTFKGYWMTFLKMGSNLLKNYTDSNGAYSRFNYDEKTFVSVYH